MKPEQIITSIYNAVKLCITDHLTPLGYQPVHEQHHDALYNSRFIIWSNNREALRLTWDGKENWFVLEITETIPLNTLSQWEEMVVVPLDLENLTPEYHDEVVQKIIKSLN